MYTKKTVYIKLTQKANYLVFNTSTNELIYTYSELAHARLYQHFFRNTYIINSKTNKRI